METAHQPSTWERSTTRRFLRFLISRRFWIGLAWVASLIVLTYAVIDWHDRREWNAYRQNFEAHVAPLEFAAYIPKPVPDSENFAMTPFAQSWMKTGTEYYTNFLFEHDSYRQADKLLHQPPPQPKGAKHVEHYLNLVAWQKAFVEAQSHPEKESEGIWSSNYDLESRAEAAPVILNAMKDDQPALDELRAASARPEARYPVVYKLEDPWSILIPHLARIKATCLRLELKTCAELAAGQSDKAFEDLKLMLYLGDTPKTEPFIISYLVRIACVQITMQPIREGLAERQWNDAQLAQLQGWLGGYNFLADMMQPVHAEEAAGLMIPELLKKNGLGMIVDWENSITIDRGFAEDSKPLLYVVGKIMPSGWYDEERHHYSMRYEDEFRGAVDDDFRRIFPSVVNSKMPFDGHMEGLWSSLWHHELIARFLLPALQGLPRKVGAGQTEVNQAIIACALERYYLAYAHYPDSLDELSPRFVVHPPNDVITGEPYRYKRSADGKFLLYSVGWNEKDDGGVPGHLLFDDSEGDWVWQFPQEKE